jgi:hypothetical protein
VFHRPLVFVSGLTVGDYLLWNWSVNGNHDVLALVSGLTLPPLAVAWLWLLALSVARLIARSARRPVRRAHRGDAGGAAGEREHGHPAAAGGLPLDEPPTSPPPARTSSHKLAA